MPPLAMYLRILGWTVEGVQIGASLVLSAVTTEGNRKRSKMDLTFNVDKTIFFSLLPLTGLEFALEVSEYVSPVLTVASALYGCYEEVKANKERCGRLVERVKVIESVVVAVTDEDLDNPLVQGALTKLKKILTSAEELVRNNGNKHWLLRAMKANNLKDQFDDLNDQLSEVSDQLSLCLQLEQLKKLREAFEAKRREEEDQRDAEDDQLGWQRGEMSPLNPTPKPHSRHAP